MKPELVQEAVGRFQIQYVLSGQQWGKAFLPVVVAAFDFAFAQGCALHPMPTNRSNASRSLIRFIRVAASPSN
jgi:hypothetical protein